MSRGPQTSIVASPVLVGAVTALVAVIAVFLAYNANAGLPFVPTYDIDARVPDAAGLVDGNEVRVGGKRVGVIERIEAVKAPNGHAEANLSLSLETRIKPLRDDSKLTVRPRSPLGLKYLELVRGVSGKPIKPNGVLPLRQAQPIVELDQVVNAFDNASRGAVRGTIDELGNATAGRGADFNETLVRLPKLLGGATRVARNLADPRTNLAGLLGGLDLTLGELDPVAPQLGSLVSASSVTAGALASVSGRLADAIGQTPSTEIAGIRALRAARPVLTDAARLVHDIRPAAPLLRPATLRLHTALRTGTPVLRRATGLADRLNDTLGAVRDLSADPDTRDTLRRLLATLISAKPTLDFSAPGQLKCNYLGLWTRNVASTISEGDASGTWFRTVVVAGIDEAMAAAKPSATLHVNPYPNTAAPGQDGECEAGNETYLPGQQIGHVPGNQGRTTESTSPPPGTPKGP
jgi:virulence factor Mce-like protein